MTRMTSQFEKTRKVSGPRALQPSQWGMLCPCDTPEGESCGLVKNLALLSHVTTGAIDMFIISYVFSFPRLAYSVVLLAVLFICLSRLWTVGSDLTGHPLALIYIGSHSSLTFHHTYPPSNLLPQNLPPTTNSPHKLDSDEAPLARLALHLGVEPATLQTAAELFSRGGAIVFLNGLLLGTHRRPQRFVEQMRQLRRSGRIGEFVSIYVADNRVYIASDGGRVCRPLIVCDGGVPRVKQAHITALKTERMTFTDFLRCVVRMELGEGRVGEGRIG